MVDSSLRRTPLFEAHKELGARLVPFAGWEMPVQYEGIIKEHEAVRTRAGLFDVSHMGELWLEGPGAVEAVDRLVTNDVKSLENGKALYTVALNERGTILDDLIVYRLSPTRILVVCNAGNLDKMSNHFRTHVEGRCSFDDRSEDTALLALQGPNAGAILAAVADPDLVALGTFRVGEGTVAGAQCVVARTGYTGEDGFEIFCSNEDARRVFRTLLERGAPHGLAPIGLGARDTLRLEAKLCLYGNDIDETTNPYEAGLGWVVKLDKATPFLGQAALRAIQAEGVKRKLIGFEMVGRGIARHDYPIVDEGGRAIGKVTSGAPGPTVGKNIGLGYVPTEKSAIGTRFLVEIRGKNIEAIVVKTPFYRRRK